MYGLQYPQISPPRALDSDASHFLSFPCGSDLSANRSLTLNTGDADRALTLQGDPTLDDWFDQAVKTSDLPTFTGLNGSTALEFKVGGNLEATLYADELRFNNGANYTAIKWDGDGMVKLGVFNGAIYIDMLNIDSDEVSTPKTMKALSFESILESGISLAITSTTMNPNLNADMVDDKHVGTSGNTIGLLDGTNTWSGDQTLAATTRTYYRDANQSIWSSAAGTLDQDATTLQQFRIANSAEMKLYADELRFINGGNYTGLAWDTNGQLDLKTKSGIMYSIRASIISTGISLPTTNRVQFRDSAIYIRSGLDSELDIVADGVVNFASAVNHSTNYIDIAGIAVPADPASSTRRLFVDTATGELSVRTSGGATVSLEASGDPDQNLWETFTADTGSATADSTTDSFDVNGGTGITTGISGDVLTIDWAAAIADLDDVSGTSGTGSTVVLTGSPTITTPTIASFANAAHDHADAAGGGQFSRNNLTGTLAIASGGTGQTAQTAAFDALAPTTTKGDVIVFNGSDNVRLPVGTDGYLIYADSTQASGVKWAKLSAAGVAEAYVTIGNSGTLTGERALTAGEGIDITDNGANSTVVISGENATDINKGIAAFDSGDFNVVDGLVSLAGGGGGAAVKSGRVTGISDGGSSAVTFNTAFPSGTVNVVATLENTNTADDCVRVSSISTTGFTINIRKGHGGAGHTWDVQWVATTAGDP